MIRETALGMNGVLSVQEMAIARRLSEERETGGETRKTRKIRHLKELLGILVNINPTTIITGWFFSAFI